MNKKNMFVALLVLLCLTLPVFAQGTAEQAKPEIRVLLANHPYGELLKTKIPEFEAETGIKAESV